MKNKQKINLKTIFLAMNMLEIYAFETEEQAKRYIKKAETRKGEYIIKQVAYAYLDELQPAYEI
tara:strand:- start:938 stop:1129 length:192 start_codon:yes stop_codon:yes gene_type:complete